MSNRLLRVLKNIQEIYNSHLSTDSED